MALNNNNPGNIEKTPGTIWQGAIYPGNNPRFVTFINPVYGYRALYKVIDTKIKRGENTINKIIASYAPPEDNNPTTTYQNFVALNSGIDGNSIITPDQLNRIYLIGRYISVFETGLQPISSDILSGFSLFTGQTTPEITPPSNLPLIALSGVAIFLLFSYTKI